MVAKKWYEVEELRPGMGFGWDSKIAQATRARWWSLFQSGQMDRKEYENRLEALLRAATKPENLQYIPPRSIPPAPYNPAATWGATAWTQPTPEYKEYQSYLEWLSKKRQDDAIARANAAAERVYNPYTPSPESQTVMPAAQSVSAPQQVVSGVATRNAAKPASNVVATGRVPEPQPLLDVPARIGFVTPVQEPLGTAEQRRLSIGLGPRQRVREFEARQAAREAQQAAQNRMLLQSEKEQQNAQDERELRRLEIMSKHAVAQLEAAARKYEADKRYEAELKKAQAEAVSVMLRAGIREEDASALADVKNRQARKEAMLKELVADELVIDKSWAKRAQVLYELDPGMFMEIASERGWHTSQNPIIRSVMTRAVMDFTRRLAVAGGAEQGK